MSNVTRTRVLPLAVLLAWLVAATGAIDAVPVPQDSTRVLTASMPTKVGNREMQPLIEGSRRGLRLDARMGDGGAWWPDIQFGDGTIELDLRGKDVPQQSFVGVAFHGDDEKGFDAVYFRPFNFRAATEIGRSHSVQYVSHPAHTWDRLRKEHPGQYEAAITPPPDPNAWFHVRVEVAHPTVRVFVEEMAAPVLEVQQLSDRKTGWVGVWVGNGSDGSFANLVITPSSR
jgi:hypothetical protein